MKSSLQLLLVTVSFLIFAVANIGLAFAQSSNTHRYQVSSSTNTANFDAIVETSVDEDLVRVAIQRKNQPTHYYSSYVQINVSAMRIGRNSLFTIYHDDQRIEAGQFDQKFSELRGVARSQRNEIIPIRKKLNNDMQILRAIRAYDKKADVILAELSYAIVTYDNSKIDATDENALSNVSVTKIAPSLWDKSRKDLSLYKADKEELNRIYKTVSLVATKQEAQTFDGCMQGAYNRYNECNSDNRITDKTICYNNRSSEVQTCHKTYGGRDTPAPAEEVKP